MLNAINKALEAAPIVPLVQANDPITAIKISEALIEGGLTVLEVVLRTDEAIECLGAIAKEFPTAHIGAGTVLDSDQAKQVIEYGATFVVSPGLDEASIEVTNNANIPILPGIATPTELLRARNLGLRTVKFFPAGLVGGPKMLKALSSVFRDMRFMPTGGVNAENLTEFLDIPSVIACGGSWLTPPAAINDGNFGEITQLAREAISIARG